MVAVMDWLPRAPSAEFTDAERDRLSAVLERYRGIVARAAAGEAIDSREEQAAAKSLEALWLMEICWRRDIAAWREMVAVRDRLQSLRLKATPESEQESLVAGLAEMQAGRSAPCRPASGGDSTLFRLSHRERELEVVHPHLFCSVHVAAFLRWETARRARRW